MVIDLGQLCSPSFTNALAAGYSSWHWRFLARSFILIYYELNTFKIMDLSHRRSSHGWWLLLFAINNTFYEIWCHHMNLWPIALVHLRANKQVQGALKHIVCHYFKKVVDSFTEWIVYRMTKNNSRKVIGRKVQRIWQRNVKSCYWSKSNETHIVFGDETYSNITKPNLWQVGFVGETLNSERENNPVFGRLTQ